MTQNLLSEQDSILRPDIETIIQEYIKTGGDISSLIELISQGYSGLPHKIIILGKILEAFGVPFQSTFESCMREWIVTNFNPKAFERYMVDIASFPDWALNMCNYPFWATVIIELMKKYPSSSFVSYLFFHSCSKNPSLIKSFPAFITNFECFEPPYQYYLNLLQEQDEVDPNSSEFQSFFSIITTDDIILGYFSLSLDINIHQSIIHYFLEHLSPPQATLFLNLLLSKYNVPYKLRTFLCPQNSINSNSQTIQVFEFDRELLEIIPPSCENNSFITEICVKKLCPLLFDLEIDLPDSLQISSILSTITENVDVTNAVENVRNNLYNFQTYPILFDAIQVPFFTYSFLPLLINRINSLTFYQDNSQSDSPESILLGEIGYYYPQLRSQIANGVINALKLSRPDQPTFHLSRLQSDLFNILYYLMKLGYDCFSVFIEQNINSDLRKQYLSNILNEIIPPFNKKWLHHLRLLFEYKNGIVFPSNIYEKATGGTLALLRNVVIFIQKLNKQPGTETSHEDIGPFDLIRRRAQDIIDRSRK